MVYLLKSPSDRPLLVNEVDAIIKRYNSVAANKHILKTLMPRTKLDVLIDGYNTENPNVKRDFYIQWLTIILAILLIPIINLNILNYQHIKDKSIEMAAMRSFGATKYNIASYFLMLNSIVVFFGCAVGYLLSFLFLKVYRIAVFDVERYSSTPFVGGGSPNVYSFAILMLVVLVLTMLTGLFPAIRLSRMNIAQSLKGGSL
jgi:ABC-type transport system, involved in lipoprotein release, permease component